MGYIMSAQGFSDRRAHLPLLTTYATCVAAACLLLAGCGSSDSSTGSADGDSPLAGDLVESGTLKVCTDPTYPPLEYYKTGQELAGYDIATARAVGEQLGLEVEFVPTAFDGILPAVDAGRCDLAWAGLFVDDKRTAKFTAVPIQETTSVIMVEAGNPSGISSPEDLAGKTVATQSGSNLLAQAEEIAAQLEDEGKDPVTVQGYTKFDQAIQQLGVGRADAVFTQDTDAAFRDLAQPGVFEVAYRFPDAETFGVYMSRDGDALADELYQALSSLEESGELARIAEEEGMPAEGIKIQEPVGG
jgi:polar amino acid transport system substrate-binding protein